MKGSEKVFTIVYVQKQVMIFLFIYLFKKGHVPGEQKIHCRENGKLPSVQGINVTEPKR